MTHYHRRRKTCWYHLMIGILAAGLTIGQPAWAAPQMHGPQRSYPKPGHVSRQLPQGHQSVRMGPDQYYFHKGVYYHREPKGFRVVTPPKGLVIERLPLGFETLIVAGITYFVLAGIFYQKTDNGYVVVDEPDGPETSTSNPTVLIVTVNLLNVRSGPGMEHPVIGQVGQGTQLVIQGNATGWYYVRLPNKTNGWVMADYTRPIKLNAKG